MVAEEPPWAPDAAVTSLVQWTRYVPRFASDDVDEVRSYMSALQGSHWRVAHGTGPMGFEIASYRGRLLAMALCTTDVRQTLRGAVRQPCLQVPLQGSHEYLIGQRARTIGAGSAMFIADDREITHKSWPGSTLALQLDGKAIAAEVASRCGGDPGDWLLQTRQIALDDAALAMIASSLADATAAGMPSAAVHAEMAEAQVVSLLADALVRDVAVAKVHALSRHRVADLSAWIDANLASPITMGNLCATAGVGERSLQAAFLRVYGVPPMQFVAQRRLALARRWLDETGRAGTVTQIAEAVGWAHLGRFSSTYRMLFGETPSQTMRRRRRSARAG